MIFGAVGHDDAGRAEPRRGGDGERAHRAGADDEHAAPVQRLGRIGGRAQLGGGQAHADGHQVRARAVDARLGVRPLGRAQRERAEVVEGPAERLVRARDGQRPAHLAEDLALAHHHGLQATGHRQQVLYRAVLVVHVQVGRELGERDAGVPGEHLADRRHARVELVDLGVDLDPVAGGHGERASDVLGVDDIAQQLARRVAGERGTLQDRDRGAAVAQPHYQDAHGAVTDSPASAGNPTPPRYWRFPLAGTRTSDLRCAWKARICNSMDRSTLRTSTPAGTFSTTGAKLRMLVTPAATSRSQTPCAAAAGVAITPMDTPRSVTISSIASLLPTTCPAAISVPTTVGSASSTAAVRKPREANPP